MADFHQFLMIVFMEFINIGPGYIRGWVGGMRGWWQKLKQEQYDTNSRV